jgi:UDP-2,3-diacylglucosamine hydrolase
VTRSEPLPPHHLSPQPPKPSGPRREYFLSDCHLGLDGRPEDREREGRLLRFFDQLVPGEDGLTIAGDLFDFWFTYRRAIPRGGFRVVSRLESLRRAGLPITFVGGNHDFWALPFFRDELGLDVVDGISTRLIQGRRFWIAHGDALGSGDLGYKLLKKVLRNPVATALYRLIHPDLGIRLATLTSHASRAHQHPPQNLADRVRREVADPVFAEGYDVVVLGHLHLPTLWEEGGKALVILGDWVENCTYLRVEGGRLFLERFAG